MSTTLVTSTAHLYQSSVSSGGSHFLPNHPLPTDLRAIIVKGVYIINAKHSSKV
jgi:hypothetical protein